MILLLHEIESAYEKEWEILKLPGGITGFLLFHVPIILLLLCGMIELYKGTNIGHIIAIIFGAGGLLPLVIHEIFCRRQERFNRISSHAIIITNAVVGLTLLVIVFLKIAAQ
jgi:uncharacterized protein with PQ loop repeat